MKTIFTLLSATFLFNFSNNIVAQNVSQNFETQTEIDNLSNSCWKFNNVSYSSFSPISGNGNVVTQLGVVSELITPELQIPSTLTISFSYNTVATNSGSKTLKVFLLINNVETILESINLNNSPSGNFSKNYTNANTPGQNVNGSRKIIFRVNNNASVQIDNLNINAPYTYIGGCGSALSTLPVKLVNFQGNLNNGTVSLKWSVAENEINDHFELERSFNGADFSTAGVVLASSKSGSENYSFAEAITYETVYYRLKMFDRNQIVTYSKILVFQNKVLNNNNNIRIIGNPTNDKLTFSFTSASTNNIDVNIYDMAGRRYMNQKMKIYEGNNMVSITVASFKAGLYIVEMNNGNERQVAKFVKQ